MRSFSSQLRTWIEIDSRAARKNFDTFRKLLGPKTKLWAVVKSNAYGHGLLVFSKLLNGFGVDPVRGREGSQRASASNGVDGFCVDSLVEGVKLRKAGIKKPILVLGPTLPTLNALAAKNKIAISISNFEVLGALAQEKTTPEFHIKIDTGMHRQGFYLSDLSRVLRLLNPKSAIRNSLIGIYTHFASAKDTNYPTYTERQFAEFQKAVGLFEAAGFKNLIKHCAATGATLINPKYHLDAVRVGIGLYGLWPSKELEMQLGRKISLRPVLSWRTVVSEVKDLEAGDYVGYDLVERVPQTKMAILPVGYWHGFPRALSSIGTVLVHGRPAKILGRVSMDLVAIDVHGIKCRPGDVATLIGQDHGAEILAADVAGKAGTTHYEFLTRLNPLIERVLI